MEHEIPIILEQTSENINEPEIIKTSECETPTKDESNTCDQVARDSYKTQELKVEQLQESINKLQSSITNMRTDIEKLRIQVADKVPKAVLSELEGKINHHSKGLDATSKKLFELQNNLTTFIQQPISHSLIDTLRTQLTQEITDSIKKSLFDDIEAVKTLFDEKIDETHKMINNAKRVMFSR